VTQAVDPRVMRIAVLTPHAAVGPEEEFPAMAPGRVLTRVVRVSAGAVGAARKPPTTPAGLRELATPDALENAVGSLSSRSVDALAYASTTSAYAIGFSAESAVVSMLSRLLHAPVAATCESAVAALRTLCVQRLAIVGAPWFDAELNELGAAYFRGQGFDVVSSMSAELSSDPDRIEPIDIFNWTLRHVRDEAEAVFIGGNGFRAAGTIGRLEASIGRPVLTANQVLLWSLLRRSRVRVEIAGYGQLFSHQAVDLQPPHRDRDRRSG
jgi:maleate isomerase